MFPPSISRLLCHVRRRCLAATSAAIVVFCGLSSSPLSAHPMAFSSTISYSADAPPGGGASIGNWTGAAFDAENIGGSGVNADGGAGNGTANDASTCVAITQPAQGQIITTGGNANGYDLTAVTVRVAGYTSNVATGSNATVWNLNPANSPIIVTVGKIAGTAHKILSMQNFMGGGIGNPGSGSSANGPGSYVTFNLAFPIHLEPNTTYCFDLSIGSGGSNAFELLGTSADPYAGGTAYSRSGTTITPLSGDRVFQVNMTASASAYAPFAHPGALHTQADFDRMTEKIAANAQPWKTDFDILVNSPWAQTGWPAYDVDYIVRGPSGNNYTRSQQDAQAIYELALRWKLTGSTAYADRAVQIANVWSGLIGIQGDTNASLGAGICGYLFAIGGEMLSTYPGWPAAEKQAYKDMMMRVFYPANFDFLWRHHGTPISKGGNTHYRLNWDTCNMASMAAIGILCDNKAVYQQAVDYFKYGTGNGRAERAAWYIHPDGTAQTEESGRDQGHNFGGWYCMALLCQMAWNQGDDLFGYDNNRVLRAYEYNAKYNLGNDVPWVYHRNASLTYTETLSAGGRGIGGYPSYELVYNHYANVKGIAAPWSKLAMYVIRPEPRPDPGIHPSAVDWLGLGSLTFARDNTVTGHAPGGLMARWSKNQVALNWWGSATATSYQIQRATGADGPYVTIGTAIEPDLNYIDTNIVNGGSYYYKVVAVTPAGNLESAPLLVNQVQVARYTFEGNTNDVAGDRHATAKGGATVPGYASGYGGGQAVSLNGADQYVQLPVGSGCYRDVTIAAWVYWNGGGNWQRVFDFGSEIEKFLMLTVKDDTGKLKFQITTSRVTDGTLSLVGPAMPTATWTHLAVSFNGDAATLYVNGLPVAAGEAPKVAPIFSQPFCYLGRSQWNGDAYFNGRIDDFRIYNYALTGGEIYGLVNQSANHAPAFASNPIMLPNATEGSNYSGGGTLASHAGDVDGGTLTYTKVTGPSWLTVAPNGALSGTPAAGDIGENVFIVRVTDGSGATDDAVLYIKVLDAVIAPPTGLTAAGYDRSVSLSWTASGDAGYYRIKRSLTPGSGYTVIQSVSGLSYVDTGLTNGTAYYYVVTSVNSDGESVDSNEASATPNTSTATFPSVASQDGYVRGSTSANTAGGTVDSTTNPSRLGDDSGNRQYKAFLSFDTSSIPDAAAIVSGTLMLRRSGLTGTDPFTILGTCYADIGGGSGFNGSATLEAADFQAAAGVTQVATMSAPAANGSWSSGVLNANGRRSISKTAASQFRVYFSTATNNNNSNNYISWNTGEDATASNRPSLVLTYSEKPASSGPLVYLHFDESSGATAKDSSGNGWDGALVNGPGWTSGRVNNAIDLSGTTSHITLPEGVVGGLGDFTISAWIKPDSLGTWARVWDFGAGTGTYMFLTAKSGGAGVPRFAITTAGSGAEQKIDGAAALPAGVWSHLAVTVSGSTGTLYVNGAVAGTNAAMTLTPARLGATTQNFIGRSQFAADPYFDGQIDEFQIFGRALSVPEISAMVAPPPAPDGLSATSGDGWVSLQWNAVGGATGYSVWRATGSGGPYMSVANGLSGESFMDVGVANGTTYYYVVTALAGVAESAHSAEAVATPAERSLAPSGLVATPGDGQVALAWLPVLGATGYNVQVGLISGQHPMMVAAGLQGTEFLDTSLTNGTTYYYVVTANIGGGLPGPESNEAVVTPQTPPLLVSAVSRKTHGSVGDLDLGLSISGASGVEPRGGTAQTLVFTFDKPLANSGTASVVSGTVQMGSPSVSGSTLSITLTEVADRQKITLGMSGVTAQDGSVFSGTFGLRVLVGDVNRDGTVNVADTAQVKSASGSTVNASTASRDVNTDGVINVADTARVKSASGGAVSD